MHDKFKPTRTAKAGVLGEHVTITKQQSQIVINVSKPIRKAYLKFLTKRYLKKQQLRDWLRVVATARNAYELRYLHSPLYSLVHVLIVLLQLLQHPGGW